MKYIPLVAIAAALLIGVFFLNRQTQNNVTREPNPSPTVTEETEIRASFTIITDNITRSFKAEKYHNQSPDIYIESSDPTVVHVKKAGISWFNFFETLPMKLTKECLITGDGEKLCNDKNGTLKFYINDMEEPDLLEKSIKEGDKALIRYTSI